MRPATGLSIGDIDHDGLHDIALDGAMSGAIPVYVQSGVDHSFARIDVTLPVEITGVTGVALTDVDTDTNDDLLVIPTQMRCPGRSPMAPVASRRSPRRWPPRRSPRRRSGS